MKIQELNRWRAITAVAAVILGIGIIISICCIYHDTFKEGEMMKVLVPMCLVVIIVGGLCWFMRDLQVRSTEDVDIREILKRLEGKK